MRRSTTAQSATAQSATAQSATAQSATAQSATALPATALLLAVMMVMPAACRYDPPPEVLLVAPPSNQFLLGEPIELAFSEPIDPASLELLVWPGQKDRYDLEGEPLADTEPLLTTCTVATSPCGADGGVTVTVSDDDSRATLTVAEGALGPLGNPLVLEVTGTLSDHAGRTKRVSRRFPFQIVREIFDPFADAGSTGGDAGDDTVLSDPLEVEEGAFLYFSSIELLNDDGTEVIALSQQFWTDIQVNPYTGTFVALMTDGDPSPDASMKDTADPNEIVLDLGEEGFIFTVRGHIEREASEAGEEGEEGGLIFQSEPFTIRLQIGDISFGMVDSVIAGRITVDEASGLSRWDGTMAVREVPFIIPNLIDHTYGEQRANFQIVQLRPEEIPADMPRVCDEAPCDALTGPQCDLLGDVSWPPASVCSD